MLRRLSLSPFFHPDDPGELLPPDPPTPGPAARVARELRCEHCECRLTPTGDVLRMSDVARGHLKSAEKISKLETKVAELETELRDARAKLADAVSTVREVKRSPLDLEF